MFPVTYRSVAFTAVLTLLGSGAASATTVPWSQLPLRVAPNAWARTPSTNRSPASIGRRSATYQAPETFLYSFQNSPDGSEPLGGLVEDRDGSLFGQTSDGGLEGLESAGTVFKLTPTRSGGYTESVIYRFGASGAQDGSAPFSGNPLAEDCTGNLYGATQNGGAYGGGTVYKLTPTKTGYHETILYNFTKGTDGGGPQSTPILDRSGALYGPASFGGVYGEGTVYKLTPTRSGYAFSVLHQFGSVPNDGEEPYGSLALDTRTGDLFGTTVGNSGPFGLTGGTVFKLRPTPSGYVYSIIQQFQGLQGPDGNQPDSSLIIDNAGALYGTTQFGGALGQGNVYKLTPTSTGYVESVLYDFTGGLDGSQPEWPLTADRRGNLYSTANNSGLFGYGTAFELVRTVNGYSEVTLHAFSANEDANPTSGVLLDGDALVGETVGPNQGPRIYGSVYALSL